MTNTEERKEAILEKVSIMIDIMMDVTKLSYSDCYDIIKKSQTYKLMVQGDVSTLHDSPQASLIELSKEPQSSVHGLFSEEVIKDYILRQRKKNLSIKK